MFYNRVIKENEFMPREKVLLLQAITALKRLGEEESIISFLVAQSKKNQSEMLVGVRERLVELRDKYSEDSYGREILSELLCDMEGGSSYGG